MTFVTLWVTNVMGWGLDAAGSAGVPSGAAAEIDTELGRVGSELAVRPRGGAALLAGRDARSRAGPRRELERGAGDGDRERHAVRPRRRLLLRSARLPARAVRLVRRPL